MVEIGNIVLDLKTVGAVVTATVGAVAWVGRVHNIAHRNRADIKEMAPKIEEIQKTCATLDERSKIILEVLREQNRERDHYHRPRRDSDD